VSGFELLRGARDVVRVGHRGAAALAPENSLAAIEVAAAHGVDAVELDVLRGRDGALVLGHDPDPAADAPALDDALALAARLGLAVQLDVKVRGIEAELADAVRGHDLLERSFVSSYSFEILAALARAEPALPLAYTYPEDKLGVSGSRILRPVVRPALAGMRALLPHRLPRRLQAAGARAATLNWSVVSPEVVAVCHGLGVAVYVWTVNDRALATRLLAAGADGIITDDPRILAPPL
jgi:glycerophosphoryl diester phosphodiesterase